MNEWTESSGKMNLASWRKPPESTKAKMKDVIALAKHKTPSIP